VGEDDRKCEHAGSELLPHHLVNHSVTSIPTPGE
jgi:hypothetical protein